MSITERILFKHLIRFVPNFIFWKNTESVYQGCNNNFAKLVGLDSPEDVIGKTDYDLGWQADGDDADIFRMRDHEVMNKKPVINLEQSLSLLTGRTVFVLMNKVPLLDANKNVIGVLGVATDVTEQKKIEQELRAAKETAEALNEAKRLFIMNLQHDIRTPFIGIAGGIDLLASFDAVKEHHEMYELIRSSTRRLLDYHNEIIKGGEALVDGVKAHEKKFRLHDVVQQAVDIQMAAAAQKGLQLELTLSPDVPDVLLGDYFALKQVLVSLLSNAVKFTREGRVALSVKPLSLASGRAILRVEVADTGIGVPKGKQGRIFELFAKVHRSNANTYVGQGVGLYLVKLYVDSMKGNIEFYSEEKRGTTIRLDLPFELPLVGDCISADDLLVS